MSRTIRTALIGLDTSHTVGYAELMHSPDLPEEKRVRGLQATCCLRFETPFQGQAGLDERQAKLEGWGIPVTEDFDTAIAECDAIMLLINDPAFHLDYFRRVAELGKPVFIDKPLCATLDEARAMLDIARSNDLAVMACSPVRSNRALLDALAEVPAPEVLNAYGMLGTPPTGSPIVWYGVHTFEMVQRVMGSDAVKLTAIETPLGCVAAVDYSDDRQAIAELGRPYPGFGGRLQTREQVRPYSIDFGSLFYGSLAAVRAFFDGGENSAPLEAAVGVMALLDAVERSLATARPVTPGEAE